MRSDISQIGWKTILSVVRNIQAELMISQVSPSTIANSQLEKFFTSCPEKLKSEMDEDKFRNKNILRILFWENHLFGKSADFVFSRIFQLSFEASWHPVFSLLLCNPLKEKKVDDESFFLWKIKWTPTHWWKKGKMILDWPVSNVKNPWCQSCEHPQWFLKAGNWDVV